MRALLIAVLVFAGCSKAFDDYAKKGKRIEAKLQFDKLRVSLNEQVLVTNKFPKLAIPLTPAEPCCKGQNKQCQPGATTWSSWAALDFQIAEPHYFQYSIESDDTKYTYVMEAEMDPSGVPKPNMIDPTNED